MASTFFSQPARCSTCPYSGGDAAAARAEASCLILNLLPLHPTESFFTLQSIGAAFCPYRVIQFGAFVKSLSQLGYVQRDAWENPDKRCTIAFDPAHSIDRYYGFTFELPA